MTDVGATLSKAKKNTDNFLARINPTFKTISKATLAPKSEVLKNQIFSSFRSFLLLYDSSSDYTSVINVQEYIRKMQEMAERLETLAHVDMELPQFFGDMDRFRYAQQVGTRKVLYNIKTNLGADFDKMGVITKLYPNSVLHQAKIRPHFKLTMINGRAPMLPFTKSWLNNYMKNNNEKGVVSLIFAPYVPAEEYKVDEDIQMNLQDKIIDIIENKLKETGRAKYIKKPRTKEKKEEREFEEEKEEEKEEFEEEFEEDEEFEDIKIDKEKERRQMKKEIEEKVIKDMMRDRPKAYGEMIEAMGFLTKKIKLELNDNLRNTYKKFYDLGIDIDCRRTNDCHIVYDMKNKNSWALKSDVDPNVTLITEIKLNNQIFTDNFKQIINEWAEEYDNKKETIDELIITLSHSKSDFEYDSINMMRGAEQVELIGTELDKRNLTDIKKLKFDINALASHQYAAMNIIPVDVNVANFYAGVFSFTENKSKGDERDNYKPLQTFQYLDRKELNYHCIVLEVDWGFDIVTAYKADNTSRLYRMWLKTLADSKTETPDLYITMRPIDPPVIVFWPDKLKNYHMQNDFGITIGCYKPTWYEWGKYRTLKTTFKFAKKDTGEQQRLISKYFPLDYVRTMKNRWISKLTMVHSTEDEGTEFHECNQIEDEWKNWCETLHNNKKDVHKMPYLIIEFGNEKIQPNTYGRKKIGSGPYDYKTNIIDI